MNKKKSADPDAPAIEECDLPDVLNEDSSEENLRSFYVMWEAEKQRASKVAEIAKAKAAAAAASGGQHCLEPLPKAAYPSLHNAIIKDFFSSMWYVQPFMCASSTAKLVQALALGYLLQSFEPDLDDGISDGVLRNGYLWAGVLVLSGFVVLMEHHHVFFWTWRKGYVNGI